MTGCTIGLPMKKEQNETISATTKTSAANTTALAASTASRRGTASSDARITPVEYSLVMVSAPSTQIASWPKDRPVFRMNPAGSAASEAPRRGARPVCMACTVSQVNSAVRPSVRTTKITRDHRVDRTDLILVHSASITWPKPALRPVVSEAASS